MEHTIFTRLALLFWFGVVIFVLWYLHQNRDEHKECDIFDIIKEHGRIAALKVSYWIAFGVMTWVVIEKQLAHQLTSPDLGIYGTSIVTPIVAKMFAKNGTPAVPVTPAPATKEDGP